MQRRKLKKAESINLIPILDAIFIFIFFLLMSAQFLDIYEIGTDAPITTTSDKHPEKDPLNLTIKLKKDKITLLTGVDAKIYKSFGYEDLDKLNDSLVELKKRYPKESSAIIKPHRNFEYYKIIRVIDHTREITKPSVFISAIDDKNKKYASTKLFDQIIFETQD